MNPKYRIELAKPSDSNIILNFLGKNFFCRDPLSQHLNLCGKKLEQPIIEYIKCILCQGMSLVALENTEAKEIVGVSINEKNCKWNGDVLEEYADFTNDENFEKFLRIRALISRQPKMHQTLSQLMIFNLAFLSAKKDQENVAMELAKVSLNLARDMNFSYARFDSTDETSMTMARKLQGVELWKAPYKNILSDDNRKPLVELKSPNTHAASHYINLKLMQVKSELIRRKSKPN
jgi:hypothetical protein